MRRALLVPPTMILLFFSAIAESQAMSAYARSFDMKCGECHKQRIPELNEFGIVFYKNGFALPGTEQGKAPTPSPEEAGNPSDPPDRSDIQVNKSPDAGGAPDEKTESSTPVPPPEIPLVIYKGQAGDGSVYFTDNPLSKRLEGAERKVRRSLAKASIVRQHPQKLTAAQKPAPPRYRTYQECMERHLENAPAASTQQMMDLLIATETACAAYSRGKP